MYFRRVKFFLGFVLVILGVLILRLGDLQLLRVLDYRDQFERRLQGWRPLPVKRGTILDRSGTRPLAFDEPCFDLSLDYRFLSVSREDAEEKYGVDQTRKTWALLETIAQANGVDLQTKLAQIQRRVEAIDRSVRARSGYPAAETRWPHVVIRGLSDTQAAEIRGKLSGIDKWTYLQPSHRRSYPHGALACHLIGVIGEISGQQYRAQKLPEDQFAQLAAELAGDAKLRPERAEAISDRLLRYHPGDLLGKSGVEKMCETQLRGRRGYQCYQRSGSGRNIVAESSAQHGEDIRLAVDLDLQQYLTRLFQDRGYTGSAVVLSVPKGEVLSLVSVPTYDLNDYYQDYTKLVGDEVDLPLMHRAVARRYPPGSPAKIITAIAGLSGGRIDSHTEFVCNGKLRPGRSGFGCTGTHGPISLTEAIKRSCNIYFYKVGDALGNRQLTMWFSMFGYDQPPGTNLPEERSGLVPTSRWLAKTGNRLYRADSWLMAIGQGKLEATPLHVANSMATIARGGKFLAPTVLLGGNDQAEPTPLPVRQGDIDLIKDGMRKVVSQRGGTAYAAFHPGGAFVTNVSVCGKTGTAETPAHRVAGQVVRSGDTAWFVGFAPSDKPKIAFAVAVEYVNDGGGGSVAGPIGRDLISMCEKLGYFDGSAESYARDD